MTENIPKRGRPPKQETAYQLKPATAQDEAIFKEARAKIKLSTQEQLPKEMVEPLEKVQAEVQEMQKAEVREIRLSNAKIELEEKIQPMHMAIYQQLVCSNKTPDEAYHKATQAADFYRAKVHKALEIVIDQQDQ